MKYKRFKLNEKSTEELLHELRSSTKIEKFIDNNKIEMLYDSYNVYLNSLLIHKNITKADVVKGSHLNRAYVYQIFLGIKMPSRDKVIALSFGLRLTFDETQSFLKKSGYRELYPRDERDSVVIYSHERKLDIRKANELLYDLSLNLIE